MRDEAGRHVVLAFNFDGEFPGLNEVISRAKKHWGGYAAMKKRYSSMVMWTVVDLKPSACGDTLRGKRVGVCVDWYCRDRRRDPDNIASGKKFILDGLVQAKVLSGDGWGSIAWFEDRFHVDRRHPRVEVRLVLDTTTLEEALERYGRADK